MKTVPGHGLIQMGRVRHGPSLMTLQLDARPVLMERVVQIPGVMMDQVPGLTHKAVRQSLGLQRCMTQRQGAQRRNAPMALSTLGVMMDPISGPIPMVLRTNGMKRRSVLKPLILMGQLTSRVKMELVPGPRLTALRNLGQVRTMWIADAQLRSVVMAQRISGAIMAQTLG